MAGLTQIHPAAAAGVKVAGTIVQGREEARAFSRRWIQVEMWVYGAGAACGVVTAVAGRVAMNALAVIGGSVLALVSLFALYRAYQNRELINNQELLQDINQAAGRIEDIGEDMDRLTDKGREDIKVIQVEKEELAKQLEKTRKQNQEMKKLLERAGLLDKSLQKINEDFQGVTELGEELQAGLKKANLSMEERIKRLEELTKRQEELKKIAQETNHVRIAELEKQNELLKKSYRKKREENKKLRKQLETAVST